MRIRSARLGALEIDVAEIITFPDGIIGFPDYKRYVELEFLEDSPLRLLQAVDEPDLGFIIIDPLLFAPDYVVDISKEDMRSLNAESLDSLAARAIVTIPEDPYEMTANLQGPLVINASTRLARQIVNNDNRYGTKHKVLANPEAPSPVGT